MTEQPSPVWFITGCSTGFGRALAQAVLAKGGRTVVTARTPAQVADLAAGHEGEALVLALDVTQPAQITAAVHAALARFGAIDVLVNNAGYGYMAAVEEGEDAAIRTMFDANVFGLAACTRAALPHMRARRRGTIVNLSSMGGFIGQPGSGYYAATKHAVEGLSDALAKEVGPLGIQVCCVEPGPFRTDFAGRSLQPTLSRCPDYEATVNTRLRNLAAQSGTQPGDPARAAEAIIAAVESGRPPRHLVLGAIAYENVRKKLTDTVQEIEAWKHTALGADYPAGRH
ncbi:MAG TPA: oxidoreductase [Candidatus Baltobacteraceae bacterium]|nr:oxidoreductase [Candidatus Baltobacteraceae bacterium]